MTIDLDKARALCAAATEGPWAAWLDQDGQPHMQGRLMVGNVDAVIPDGEDYIEGVDVNPIAECYTPEDRAFIAAARTLLPEALDEIERLRAHIERNGIQWCMCSRADRMDRRRIPRCPYRGDGMAVQRNVAEQERDEAEAALRRVRGLHQELWDCGNARHTNPDAGCPECVVLCCHCGDSWPCETIAILDGGDR